MQSFSERLTQARKREGLTQPQLAKKLGVSNGAVGNWEVGRGKPGPKNLRRLCEILKLEPEPETPPMPPIASAEPGSIPLGLLSDEILDRIAEHLAELRRSGVGRPLVRQALERVMDEQDRRQQNASPSDTAPSSIQEGAVETLGLMGQAVDAGVEPQSAGAKSPAPKAPRQAHTFGETSGLKESPKPPEFSPKKG